MPYYVRIRGRAFGPFDQSQIIEMKTQGRISRTTEISENQTDWLIAADVDFLFARPTEADSSKNRGGESTSSDPAVWLYSVDGQTGYGPISAKRISEMLGNGALTENSLIWREGENARTIREEPIFSKPIKSHHNDPFTVTGDVSLAVLDPLFKSSGWITFLKVCAVLYLVSLALTGLGQSVAIALAIRPLGQASATIIAIIFLLGCSGIFYFCLRSTIALWAYHASISKLMYDRTESGLIDNHAKILAFWKNGAIFVISVPVIAIVTVFLCIMFMFALGTPPGLFLP